ncbi:sugar ABC transporter ATP-binding protein [Acuticoccus kandeliae]|uniref:sugar ABC transporter ATP-binding protein n=1 Tax=Acuticoccus kandeliae TaxID=2073160 RepID=UPI000D3EBBA5|nr:sugar ABC transporter ATP-binding protein [Acuticoccus kandeliae]
MIEAQSDRPAQSAAADPVLELAGISKSFGGVRALSNVDFTLRAGEIHALVGENGAGKSTLMKIIAGVHTADEGEIFVRGEKKVFRSARDARDAGVGMVHQELSVARDLTVAENVFLGAQPVTRFGLVDWRAMVEEAGRLLKRLGLEIDPRQRLGDLPVGLQQLVELARVLFSDAKVIILDEPTSALSPPEIARLFDVLGKLKGEEGRSFVFISHFLEDVLQVADRVTVMRNGERVATEHAAAIDKGWIIQKMIGADHGALEAMYTGAVTMAPRPTAGPVLAVENLSSGSAFSDVTFSVAPGEVLGVYGFMGCGQLELARALFGKIAPDTGRIAVDGAPCRFGSTASAKSKGLAFVPESRAQMLFADQPVFTNMSISVLDMLDRIWLRPDREREIARGHVATLGVRPANELARLRTLSGGNQQKVALGRWMTRLPRILILCEPTRGMDVGAKEDVVRIVKGLSAKGVAVVVMSTEPETVLSLATRVIVMRKGRIVDEFCDRKAAKDDLLAAA